MFKPLIELFTEELCTSEPQGSNLPTVINEIWDIFSDTLADKARCSLLDEIRGDVSGNRIVNRINGEYEAKSEYYWVIATRLEYDFEAGFRWEEFCCHLKSVNRFFPGGKNDPQNDPTHVIKKMILLMTKAIHPGEIFYRSRVSPSNVSPKFYMSSELNAPPPEDTRNNRISPKGIPVLYMADSEKTAIAEARPWVGTIVSIAAFKAVRDLKIVDFSVLDPFNHPFQNSDIAALRMYKYIATILNRAFSTPVSSSDSLFEYLPTQYIASLIKNEGIDGIRYRSSVHVNGKNMALFDCEACIAIGSPTYFEIEKVNYKHRKHSSSMSYRVRKQAQETRPLSLAIY